MKAILPRRGGTPVTAAAVAILLAAGGVAALSGCSPTVTTHGHRLDADLVAQVRPGVTTRDEVSRLLGSPSSVGTFDGQSWYYVTQKTERRSFYQANVAAQDVVRVDFDGAGLVSSVDRAGLEAAQAVDPAEARTRTLGNELTIVQQFLGNIGRFNTAATPDVSQQGSAARR